MSRINNHDLWQPRMDLSQLEQNAQPAFPEPEDRWQTFDDWARLPPLREIVRGALVAGPTIGIGGPKGCCKTLLTLDLLTAWATATPWLMHPAFGVTEPMRVGLISCESSRQRLTLKHDLMVHVRAAAEQARAAEIMALDRQNMVVDNQLIDLGTEAGVQELVGRARQRQLQVLAIDPLHNFFGSMGKDVANTPMLSRHLADIALRMADIGCTLLVNAHPAGDRIRQQQNRVYEPLEVQDLAWPGLYNHLRQYVMVSRSEAFNKETRTSQLWLNIGGSDCPEGGQFGVTICEGLRHDRWECRVERRGAVVETQQTTREQARYREDRENMLRIEDYLSDYPEGRTINAIMGDSNRPRRIGRSRLTEYLREMARNNRVHSNRQRVSNNDAELWFPGPEGETQCPGE